MIEYEYTLEDHANIERIVKKIINETSELNDMEFNIVAVNIMLNAVMRMPYEKRQLAIAQMMAIIKKIVRG